MTTTDPNTTPTTTPQQRVRVTVFDVIITSVDQVFTEGDAVVELVDGTHTFVAANKVGRDATLRAIEEGHPDKRGLIHIAWRDAGEGWPDTWLGFSFPTTQDRQAATAIAAHGARVFHRGEGGEMTYLVPSAQKPS
jgi:hypothetical protein